MLYGKNVLPRSNFMEIYKTETDFLMSLNLLLYMYKKIIMCEKKVTGKDKIFVHCPNYKNSSFLI